MADEKDKPPLPATLLWVNHDAQNMRSQAYRQKVFSHIQQQYRPWLRRDSALKLRKAAKLPLTVTATTSPRRASVDSEEDPSDFSDTSPASSFTSYSSATDLSVASLGERKTPPRSVQHQADLFRKAGNADPFNAYPIVVSARVNDILKFYRDVVLPSQYHTGTDGWLTLQAAADDWRDVVRSLNEKGGALGFLARWAQVASNTTNNPELAMQSLRFRAQSTSDLLKKMQQGSGIASRSSYWHVIALYMAEAQAGNADAAWTHAAMLSKALKHESEIGGEVDITSLRSFMYNEACACCMFLKKPVLDYGDWIALVFRGPWAEGRAQLPAMNLTFPAYLDASIDDPILKEMFLQQREGLAVWRHGSQRAEGLSPEVFTWWCSNHLVKHTRLLKYALDCVDAAKSSQRSGTSPASLEKNAYLALTAVYWTRLIAGDETLLGKAIYETKPPLRRLTRDLLERDRRRSEFTGSMQNARARLWALYVGAQAEHSESSGAPKPDQSWFSDEFALQAQRMGSSTWSTVQEILAGFLDCDVVEPRGERFAPGLLTPKTHKAPSPSTKSAERITSFQVP